MKDPVTIDEQRHDREGQKWLTEQAMHFSRELDKTFQETYSGEHDSDMANFFDGQQLMRVARLAATASEGQKPMFRAELEEIAEGIREYARDLAERRATRAMQ